jgi:hypothetical protein
MQAADKRAFKDALDLAFETVGKPLPSAGVLTVFWASLEAHPLDAVLRAISKHVKVSEFAPSPAAILKHLPAESDGRPDANEAWAISLRSRDERDTVVWTQECAEAFAICSSVLEGGDEVGARMAFKAAYERLVECSRAAGKPVQWIKSLGHDPDLREAAIVEAVRVGRLQLADARTVLPALAAPEEGYDSAKAEANLAKLREMVGSIPSTAEKLARAAAQESAITREMTDAAKQRTAQRVADYQASHA